MKAANAAPALVARLRGKAMSGGDRKADVRPGGLLD